MALCASRYSSERLEPCCDGDPSEFSFCGRDELCEDQLERLGESCSGADVDLCRADVLIANEMLGCCAADYLERIGNEIGSDIFQDGKRIDMIDACDVIGAGER